MQAKNGLLASADEAWENYKKSVEMVTLIDATQWEKREAAFRAGYEARQSAEIEGHE